MSHLTGNRYFMRKEDQGVSVAFSSCTGRAMRLVPTVFPTDQWPGEPLMEAGISETCLLCKRTFDVTEFFEGLFCLECWIRGMHPVHGAWIPEGSK